jgi:hypothetical protein
MTNGATFGRFRAESAGCSGRNKRKLERPALEQAFTIAAMMSVPLPNFTAALTKFSSNSLLFKFLSRRIAKSIF